jgi:hypothetical protein
MFRRCCLGLESTACVCCFNICQKLLHVTVLYVCIHNTHIFYYYLTLNIIAFTSQIWVHIRWRLSIRVLHVLYIARVEELELKCCKFFEAWRVGIQHIFQVYIFVIVIFLGYFAVKPLLNESVTLKNLV